jgi:hypothetical protein
MKRANIVKAIVALMVVLIVLPVSISDAQTSQQLKVDGSSSVNVLPANVIWAKTYGGTADDRAFFALPVSDGFLVVGSTRSIVVNTTVGWVLRIDGVGDQVWNKTYLEGFGTEIRYAVNLTDGYLLVGNEFFASGAENGYVAKIDNQGNLLWKTILSNGETDKLFSGIANPDGFVVFGLASSTLNGASAGWAVKLDLNGNVIWNKTYGTAEDSALRTGVLAEDGDYVAAGYMNSTGNSIYTFYLLKVDPNGNIIWNKTYGGVNSAKAYSMTQAPDGYVLVGDIESPIASTDAWVVRVDLNGNMLWSKELGGKIADSPAYITQAQGGGYLVAGFTFSFGAGNRDFWLFKISDQGQVLSSCTQGNEGFQEAYCIIQTGNNQYLMVGWTDPPGQPALIGKATYDFYIVKLSAVSDNSAPSNFQFVPYATAITITLLVVLLLLFLLRSKRKVVKN